MSKDGMGGNLDTNMVAFGDNFIQNEQWFEISKGVDKVTIGNITGERLYTLVINSYGRVRKLFHDGGYEDVYNGGVRKENNV